MADVRQEVYILQSDGTAFSSANEAGAEVRLRESTAGGADGGEYTGNVAASGDFIEVGNGLWYINIDTTDSGYYLVESNTTAAGAWTSVNGYAPAYFILSNPLFLSGGTMTANIAMGDNSVTGINDITFTDGASGTINSIIANNLIDRATPGTISGTLTQTGFIDITASKLKIGGTAVTATAANMNQLSALTDTYNITTCEKSLAYNTHSDISGNTTLTIADAGHIPIDTSGGAYQIVMPNIVEATSGVEFMIYTRTGGTDITIIDNAANGGFSIITGAATEATGDTLTFGASAGECVLLKSNGGTTTKGVWMIVGGKGIALT